MMLAFILTTVTTRIEDGLMAHFEVVLPISQ